MLDNVEIISKLKSGNKKTFQLIYKEYYEVILYICLQYLTNREDAKEAVQDAFVKLWTNRSIINENKSLYNFLYTIAKNNCLSSIKKNEVILKKQENIKWMEMQSNYEALHRLDYESLEFKELQEKIEEAIERLPEQCRKVFKLSRFSQLKNKEIAEQLNLNLKTVEAHMTKSLRLLKQELKPYLSIILLISDILR
ncbi:MAG: RNA polymerase sigma-70 factor [Carboxylicivirga sp.]|jgi:RNA polymerase sigma-70 factor (ECF subfamily)|nr:RNA polymerase sigma-70 factor [Carboxylicivirga sp.]